jgi:epoxyqueuosine reductase
MTEPPQAIKDAIRAKARELKFDAVGIAGPDIDAAGDRLGEFLAAGWQGDMDWLEAKRERRADPRTLWPEVRGIIVLGLNYGPAIDPLGLCRGAARTIGLRAGPRLSHVEIAPEAAGFWLQSTHGGG